MGNVREDRRNTRLRKIKKLIKINMTLEMPLKKEYLIAKIMVEDGVSKRVAREDIEAISLILEMEE